MNELYPILSGTLIGAAVGFLRQESRLWASTLLSILFGTFATLVSGEFRVSWGYLLVDIPLVAGSTLISMMLVHNYRRSLPRS